MWECIRVRDATGCQSCEPPGACGRQEFESRVGNEEFSDHSELSAGRLGSRLGCYEAIGAAQLYNKLATKPY